MSSFTDDVIHLKNAGTWSGGGTPSKANPDFWDNGDIPWVSPKDMKTFELHDSQDKITAKAIEASPVKLVPAGSVLMVVRSGILAHTFPVAIAKTAVTLNQDMKAITPHLGLLPEFLAYQLRAQGPKILKTCTKSGTTVASVETKQLQALPIWVPAAETQFKVVEDLDTQLSRLEATVTTLRKIQARIKHARASTLKAAVEGRLVKIDHSSTDRFTKELDHNDKIELPPHWQRTTIKEICDVSGGITKNASKDQGNTLVPYLRVANVYTNQLVLSEIKEIQVPDHLLEKYLLAKGDLLIVEGNGSLEQLGRVAIWDGSIEGCVHQNHLIKARPHSPSTAKYILTYLNSPHGRRQIKEVSSSTSGLHTLSISKIERIELPLPPEMEIHKIMDEVDRRFSVLDRVEATANNSLRRCDQLRHAALQRAFRE